MSNSHLFKYNNIGDKMRIGIDIDGVLTDIEQWQLDYGSKFFSQYGKTIINSASYETSEIFGVSNKLDDAFWDKYLLEYATKEPARKFTDEITQKLKNDNHEIYIITARAYANTDTKEGEVMRDVVIKWLKEYNICYDKIIFSPEDKLETCLNNNIDLMIEDKVENIMNISTKIPVICFDAGYNKNCKGNNIYRAYAWYDVYDLINHIKKKNN